MLMIRLRKKIDHTWSTIWNIIYYYCNIIYTRRQEFNYGVRWPVGHGTVGRALGNCMVCMHSYIIVYYYDISLIVIIRIIYYDFRLRILITANTRGNTVQSLFSVS